MTIIDKARAMRVIFENLAAAHATETQIDDIPDLLPVWKAGETYAAGDRVRYDGKPYKILQGHTSTAEWTPAAAPSLFAVILPGQDGTEIGDWEQPDSTNGYSIGDRVRFEGKIYESVIDNNVWSPSANPAGWVEVAS